MGLAIYIYIYRFVKQKIGRTMAYPFLFHRLLIKGKLVRQLPSYERFSWPAFSPSCQQHQQVGNAWTPTWKPFGRETLCFLGGKVASVVAKAGSLFPRVRASICKSGRQKVHRTVARAWFHIKLLKNWGSQSAFGRWGRQISFIDSFIHFISFHFISYHFISIHSSIASLVHSLNHSIQFSSIQFNLSFMFFKFSHFNSLLSSSPTIPISKLVPIISIVVMFRPGTCRVLPGIPHKNATLDNCGMYFLSWIYHDTPM